MSLALAAFSGPFAAPLGWSAALASNSDPALRPIAGGQPIDALEDLVGAAATESDSDGFADPRRCRHLLQAQQEAQALAEEAMARARGPEGQAEIERRMADLRARETEIRRACEGY